MQTFTINPPWLRNILLLLSGLSCLAAGVALTAYLLADTLPSPAVFLPLLFGFLLNGCIFIFTFSQEGPLKEALWVSGTLSAISAVTGFLALVVHPESQPFESWQRPLFISAIAILAFWVANTRIKLVTQSVAS